MAGADEVVWTTCEYKATDQVRSIKYNQLGVFLLISRIPVTARRNPPISLRSEGVSAK
jgi:hypothetical protein